MRKRQKRREVERKAEQKGREGAVVFVSNSTLKRSKCAILVSNSVSFNWTILASVLSLCPSCCLSFVSSKYLVPRATDIQTEGKKHEEWSRERLAGRTKTFKSSFLTHFCILFWIRPKKCTYYNPKFCQFHKTTLPSPFVRSIETKLLKLSNIYGSQCYNIRHFYLF